MTARKLHLDHFADTAHGETIGDTIGDSTITRIQSAVIFGSIGSGLIACAVGSFIFDLGRAFAAW